jgi:O-acetylhomoserine (thiol)-lyase
MGATISPFAAFQILQGLETLPVCMEQHNANAIAVANYLAGHSKVEKVYFPGLQTGEHRRRADAYLLGGYGALVGFELKDGAEAGKRFIDAIKLIYHVANIGDARTLAIHPATTTHSQPTEEDQLATGVTQAMCACLSA